MDSQTEKQMPPVVMEQPESKAPPPEPYATNQPSDTAQINYSAGSPQVLLVQVFGSQPINMICTNCNENIITTIKLRVSSRTHLYGGLCCLLGGLLCVWVPYVMDKTKAKDHYCPNCEQFLGTGKPWPDS